MCNMAKSIYLEKFIKNKKESHIFWRILLLSKTEKLLQIKLQIQRYITNIKGEIAMVQILAGEKGEGKTKRLVAMANEASKSASGCVVFVDDDNSRMYDLHYSVRFVETPKFIMESPQVFRGFVCGILSQNSDIEKIYIDGLNHIIDKVTDDEFVTFIEELGKLSKESELEIVMIISRKGDLLPAAVQSYLV